MLKYVGRAPRTVSFELRVPMASLGLLLIRLTRLARYQRPLEGGRRL